MKSVIPTMNNLLNKADIDRVISIAKRASSVLMHYFENDVDIEIEEKFDTSPITIADRESNDLICNFLKNNLDVSFPVISEENDMQKNEHILNNEEIFWLVDPLDGTWSFSQGRPTFTINIALVKQGIPVWGLIAIPFDHAYYYIDFDDKLILERDGQTIYLPKVFKSKNEQIDILTSSRNFNQQIEDFVNLFPNKTVTPIPSAVKFCIMAEGKADIYPRFKPTYSWDTAAGHALLKNIGGTIINAATKEELKYNTKLLNPNFIAIRDTALNSL